MNVLQNQTAGTAESKSGTDGNSESQTRGALVAVDLGAESCRVSLLRWVQDRPGIELVYRFQNSTIDEGNGLRWDHRALCKGV